jgi:hypothetical protein
MLQNQNLIGKEDLKHGSKFKQVKEQSRVKKKENQTIKILELHKFSHYYSPLFGLSKFRKELSSLLLILVKELLDLK